MNPHDPDPLIVLEDQDPFADLHLRPPLRHERLIVVVLLGLVAALGLFVGVRFAAATSRPAPEHVVPASVQGPIGAPPPATKVPGLLAAGDPSNGHRSPGQWSAAYSGIGPDGAETAAASSTPSPVTVFEDTSPGITGTASFVSASYGPRYLALPGGPGIRVTICGRGGCVTRTSTDAGPSLFRQRQGRIADLSHADFFAVCGCPSWAGLTQVTVTPAGPRPTPPATDATP